MAKPAVKEKKEEKVDPKAKAVKAEVVVKKTKEEELMEAAKAGFKDLQLSWFKFAKAIWMIRSLEAYKEKYDTFKDYCEKEFPSMEYSTLVKYCIVAENFSSAIEEKFKKDENYVLPSYHSFYLVASVKDADLMKEEVSKYRKMVLDARIGFHTLRQKLKELVDSRKKEMDERSVHPIEDIEKALEKDIRSLDLEEEDRLSEEMLDLDDESDLDEDEIEEEDEDSSTIEAIQTRVTYLIDNLPDFENELTKKLCGQDDSIDLAESMNKLYEIMEKFLNKFEKLNK